MRSTKKDIQKPREAGFSLIELLIVVAIILIIAAIAIPNLMRARIASNESAGAATIRSINTAEATYSTTYGSAGYATNLTTLGPNGVNCSNPANVSPTSACLLDNVLGCGASTCNKGAFAYTISSSTASAPVPDYVISAVSLGPALAGKDYCSITDAVVRFRSTTTTPGSVASPITASACSGTGFNAIQ